MTKKFIHTDKSINGQEAKDEFLIPDVFDGSLKFIGLESNKTYDYGKIVFTGVTLDIDEIYKKQ